MRGSDRMAGLKSIKNNAAACAAAFQLLTRLPVRMKLDYTSELFRRSVVFYPVVGLLLGLLLACAGIGVARFIPAAPGAVLLTCFWVALTGALHLDGLMDTADGLLSHRSRERMLEIMKDSRVGAMGVVAGVLALMMKASLLYTLFGMPAEVWWWIVLVPLWSRAFMTWAIAGWPYARAEGGMGNLVGAAGKREALLAVLFAWGFTAALALVPTGAHVDKVIIVLGAAVLTAGVGWGLASAMSRKLGGLTGDTYGALNELLEIVVLLWIVVIWSSSIL
jgi:adenosylcobinamide-GDP ribazoletransferase